MKNLLNCHTIGLHSFPISLENNLYKRIFYADTNHHLFKPLEIAIHPHHVDIKITILDGDLYNQIYELSNQGESLKKFLWNSHILNGKGGFEYLGEQKLKRISNEKYSIGETIIMRACELHTVYVEQGKKCVWLIEESAPTCEYFPINYSDSDLTKWSADGLYIEVGNEIRDKYILKYTL